LTLSLDLGWLAALVLLATRLAAFFLMTPLLAGARLPAVFRLVLIFGLAIVLAGSMPAITFDFTGAHGLGRFIAAIFTEFALGATLALGVQLALAMFSFAGRVLDVQIGFGIAQVVDPVTNQQLPILSAAFYQLGIVAFFVGNVHHTLLRGMAAAIERFPVGQPWTLSTAFDAVLPQVAAMFALGFALAAPIVACLLLVELGLGVLSRNLPQMNVFALGLPIKVLTGLTALSLWVTLGAGVVARIYSSIFQGWKVWFAHG
jgi:flagellar biosynthetic protein FliR